MQLADFHPLHVALHGSSGFFSRAAFFRIHHWIKTKFQSAYKKLDTLSIHIAPESNANGHQYLCRLELFENSFRSFSFGHYLIAQCTLDSSSIGSAGKSFEHMQSGFVKPFSQEYNAMKFQLHEYTSMKYDSMVGKGVLNIVDYAKNNPDVDDESTVVSTLSHHIFCPASDEVLQKLAWSFQDQEVEKFVELFGTDNCFIEHPQNTLPYCNQDIRAYFHNIMKRHTEISMFSIVKNDDGVNMGDSGLSQASEVLTARLVGELFDGSEVDYILHGECLMDAESKQITSLGFNGSPYIQCLKKNGDQRNYIWNGEELMQHCISNEGMGVSYCRPLSPAEQMAYEMNSVPDKAKSDGLTIVARSVIDGPLPTEMSIQEALKFVKNMHPLLNSHIQILIKGELIFISTLKDCRRSIPLEILIDNTIDCEALMDTKFYCLEGDFLRVIISMNSGDHKQEAEGDEPSSKETFFELIMVIYHRIFDAISVRELHHQIIREIAAILNNEPYRNIISDVLKNGPTPLPITAELLVKKALDQRQAKTDFQVDGKLSTTPSPPCQPLEQAPLSWSKGCTPDNGVQCSRAIKHKFSAKKTRKMLDLISAAALIATSECGKAAKRVLCSVVDLRHRVQLKKSELVYAVGGFDGSAAFEYDIVDADIDIWELLARQV